MSKKPTSPKGVQGAGYDPEAAERVRRKLSGRRDVVERRMVGGLSFMVDGSMCCGVTGAALMVRVGSDGRERALARPHARPMKFAGHALAGFVCVDPEGYRTDASLAAWVQRGIDFVSTLPAKKPLARGPKPSSRRKWGSVSNDELELVDWQPLTVPKAADLMGGHGAEWWIAGGWAIDLFLKRLTRDHADIDVLVLRRDHVLICRHLSKLAWELWAVDRPGHLRPIQQDEAVPSSFTTSGAGPVDEPRGRCR